MSNEIKYCGNCGIANSINNNFCNQCGSPFNLIKSKEITNPKRESNLKEVSEKKATSKPKLNPDTKSQIAINKITSEYKVLQDKVIKLSKVGGTLEVKCKENFLRFIRKKDGNVLVIDLGTFEDEEDTVVRIKELGYNDADGRFKKSFNAVDLDMVVFRVIEEAKMLFETVFKLSPPLEFAFEEQYNVEAPIRVKSPKAIKAKSPIKSNQGFKEGAYGCLIILGFIVIVLMFVGYCNGPSTTQEPKIDLESNNMKANAFIYSKPYVKNNLKQPHTADFPVLDFSCSVNLDDSTYYVISYVDAQNSFGASIRNKFVVVMKYKGGEPNDQANWTLNSMEFLSDD